MKKGLNRKASTRVLVTALRTTWPRQYRAPEIKASIVYMYIDSTESRGRT